MNYASLCILSYNRPEFLRKCILSARGNTKLPMEIIVHDDGSDIDTQNIILQYLQNDLISSALINQTKRNEGQGRALNKLFACASGDILIAADQDLLFLPRWLETVRSILEHNEITGISGPQIGSLGGFKYEHDPVDYRKMWIDTWGIDPEGDPNYDELWEEHEDYVGSFMAFTREGWEKFGPFEQYSDAFAEDAVIKRKIFETDGWCNALPPEDIVINDNFGIGPSTVVAKQKDGKVGVTPIYKEPLIIYE